jgi:hypothetical protein
MHVSLLCVKCAVYKPTVTPICRLRGHQLLHLRAGLLQQGWQQGPLHQVRLWHQHHTAGRNKQGAVPGAWHAIPTPLHSSLLTRLCLHGPQCALAANLTSVTFNKTPSALQSQLSRHPILCNARAAMSHKPSCKLSALSSQPQCFPSCCAACLCIIDYCCCSASLALVSTAQHAQQAPTRTVCPASMQQAVHCPASPALMAKQPFLEQQTSHSATALLAHLALPARTALLISTGERWRLRHCCSAASCLTQARPVLM